MSSDTMTATATDLGYTKKIQPQEPEPSRDATVRDCTLTLDYDVIASNIGFRAPFRIRAILWLCGLVGRARAFDLTYYRAYERAVFPPVVCFVAKGWQDCATGACYVTRVVVA